MQTFFSVRSTAAASCSGSSTWRRSISSTTCQRARAKTSCNASWTRKPLAAMRRSLQWRIRPTTAASSSDLLTPRRWAPGRAGNYEHGRSVALYCAQELLVCSRTWCFSPSVCFISIVFLLIRSLYFKTMLSLNQRSAISEVLVRFVCFLCFFFIFAPSRSYMRGLGPHKQEKNITQGNLWINSLISLIKSMQMKCKLKSGLDGWWIKPVTHSRGVCHKVKQGHLKSQKTELLNFILSIFIYLTLNKIDYIQEI